MGRSTVTSKQVVLVVEDEPLLRMMAIDLVEDAGFEALEARDATEAVAILEARPDVRIMFTDVDMPGGIDGLKLAALVRDRWPPIKIIITSGHLRVRGDMIPAWTEFFPKPYNTQDVVAMLHHMAEH
jgi:DNA-binding NtrC family response regulator